MSEHEFHYEKVAMPEADAVVYRMDGVLGDTEHCYDFLKAFLEDLPDAPQRIVFNFCDLETVYSAGIGIVANCFTKARDAGKTLALACVPPIIHRALTLTGVQPLLKDYGSEAEAIAGT